MGNIAARAVGPALRHSFGFGGRNHTLRSTYVLTFEARCPAESSLRSRLSGEAPRRSALRSCRGTSRPLGREVFLCPVEGSSCTTQRCEMGGGVRRGFFLFGTGAPCTHAGPPRLRLRGRRLPRVEPQGRRVLRSHAGRATP